MIKEVKNENADIFFEKNAAILVNAFYEKVRQINYWPMCSIQ